MDNDYERRLIFTEEFKDCLAWMDVSIKEWHVIRDRIVELAFMRYPNADAGVCKVQCCKEIGEAELYRLKLREIRMRVFFTYDAQTMTFWFALRRTENTYAMVEILWRAQWANS